MGEGVDMSDEMKVQTKGLNKKFIFIAIALIVAGLVAALVLLLPTSTKGKKVEEQLNLGAKYLSELNYEQAIVAYEAVIKIDPKCEEAYLALADVYIAMGEFDKAEEVLKKAEASIGSDVTDAVAEKRKEVEKVRKEQERPESTPSPTPTNIPTPATHTIYDGTIVELSEAKVGDVVLFGTYEQDNIASNGAETIPWYVLDKDGDKLLLMSVYLLDSVQYHEQWKEITWEESTLRQWMNDAFYIRAFAESEKKHILTSYLKNEDNPYYRTEGGNDTEDKIFALSLEEAEKYFGFAKNMVDYWFSETPELSAAKVTAYAEAKGVYVTDREQIAGNGGWWLRSPGSSDYRCAVYILDNGHVSVDGNNVSVDDYGHMLAARPAFWLNLNP